MTLRRAQYTGLTPAQAREGAAQELKPLLQSLVAKGAEAMRAENFPAASKILKQIDATLSGLVSQVSVCCQHLHSTVDQYCMPIATVDAACRVTCSTA
jgi:hypothetical protein